MRSDECCLHVVWSRSRILAFSRNTKLAEIKFYFREILRNLGKMKWIKTWRNNEIKISRNVVSRKVCYYPICMIVCQQGPILMGAKVSLEPGVVVNSGMGFLMLHKVSILRRKVDCHFLAVPPCPCWARYGYIYSDTPCYADVIASFHQYPPPLLWLFVFLLVVSNFGIHV